MKRFLVLLALTLVVLGLLSAHGPLAAAQSRPFRGKAVETVTDAVPVGPGLLQLTVTARGQATHVGLFTGTEHVLFDALAGTVSGSRVFIAANGDNLYADTEGAFTSPTTVDGTMTFTGGTGRFKHASGEMDFEVFTLDGVNLTLTFDGDIDF